MLERNTLMACRNLPRKSSSSWQLTLLQVTIRRSYALAVRRRKGWGTGASRASIPSMLAVKIVARRGESCVVRMNLVLGRSQTSSQRSPLQSRPLILLEHHHHHHRHVTRLGSHADCRGEQHTAPPGQQARIPCPRIGSTNERLRAIAHATNRLVRA